MILRRSDALSFSARLIAVTLIILGLALDVVWAGGTAHAWVWSGLSLTGLFLLGQHDLGQRFAGMTSFSLSNPWLWLGLALTANGLIFLVGYAEHGALRHYSEVFRIRAGLWSLLLYVVFLTLYCQLAAPGMTMHIGAVVGTALLAVSMLAQPDIFTLLLLVIVGIVVGRKAHHAGRFWLPMVFALISAFLISLIVSSPFRMQRLTAYLTRRFDDPTGLGFETKTLQQAIEQGGRWGHPDGIAHSGMSLLPNSAEWYSVAYLGVWQGQVAVLLALALFIVFAMLVFQLGRRAVGPVQKTLVQAGLLIFLLNSVVATAGSYGLILNGHYGMAFLSGGEMSLVAVLLLAVACSRKMD